MTYDQFVELINMPAVLVIIFCIVFMGTFGIIWIVKKLQGKDLFE
jgi:hypothetical protein